MEFTTTDERLDKVLYNGIHRYLDEGASIYVRRRTSRRDLYEIGAKKAHVIEAIELYVYHPVKRVKIAVVLATSRKNKYPHGLF